MANLRKCIVCGTSYDYCASKSKLNDAWRNIYCSEDCRVIFNTCSSQKISSDDAVKALDAITIPAGISDEFKKKIDDIMATKKPKRKIVPKPVIVEPDPELEEVETETVVEVKQEVIEDNAEEIEPPKKRRGRRKTIVKED